jgi:penicillin-insensitive murein endopeptidase
MPVKSKKNMTCNKPQTSWRPAKKRVVKACFGGKEKIIHFGAKGFGNNYNSVARKSFRARYWACKNLWTKGGDSKSCPKSRRCKGASPKRKSVKKRKSQRKSPRKSPRRRSPPRKSPKRKSPKRKSPNRKSRRK